VIFDSALLLLVCISKFFIILADFSKCQEQSFGQSNGIIGFVIHWTFGYSGFKSCTFDYSVRGLKDLCK